MNLRKIRFELGMRQWDLSLISGISQSKLSLIERGYIVPSDEDKRRICEALNLDRDEIYWPNKEGKR